jgi:cytochrome c-type biogenesis protein CcmF
VLKNGEFVEVLAPQKRVYNASGMVMTEAAIDSGFTRDLYVSLGEPVDNGESWIVRVYHKPYIDWIWAGCFLMALGGLLAVCDRRYRVKVRDRFTKSGSETISRPGAGTGASPAGVLSKIVSDPDLGPKIVSDPDLGGRR